MSSTLSPGCERPLLAQRDFRLIFLASLSMALAGATAGLAIPLTAVTLLHAGSTEMGLLAVAELAPFALFSLPAGPWIDRSRKKPLGIGFNLLAALASLLIPLAYMQDQLSMPVLYAVGFVVGTCGVIGGSATQVHLTQVVGRPQLLAANAQMTAAQSAVAVIGPAIAALLIARFGAPLAVTANAMLFVLTAVLLWRIERDDAIITPARTSWWPQALEGLRMIRDTPMLRALAIFTSLWLALIGGFGAQFVLFSTRTLGLDANQLALVCSFGAAGALLGSFAARRFERRQGARAVMLTGFLVSAIGIGFYAVAPSFPAGTMWVAAVIKLLMDFGITLYTVNYISLRHRITPDVMLGRVTTSMRGLAVSAAPVGALFWAMVADSAGITSAMLLIAACGIALWVVAFRRLPHPVFVSESSEKSAAVSPAPTFRATESA